MTAYIIIPGIDGSDEQHWQSLWEREWGTSAVRISPASWTAPNLDDWVGAIQRAYDDASQDDQVALVAHSLGCWAAATWLARTGHTAGAAHTAPPPVAAAFLVAPPDPSGPGFPRHAAASFTEVAARPLRCPALVVSSTDDPYCTSEAAAGFATGWQARRHVLGAHGHINSRSGLGAWPQGRTLLADLLKEQSPLSAPE